MENVVYGPLTGIRILDISTMIAAPYAATLLADLGAEVIKVELPGQGDTLRHVGPWKGDEPLRWPGLSRNKKSITLNLQSPKGKLLFMKLVQTVDLVIENFRPGTLERWGLGYDVLKEVNPRLLLARVSGFGQTGPYHEKAGFGTPGTAFSGYTYLQRYRDRPPVSPSFSLLDYMTGVYIAFASASALYYRDVHDQTEGQIIEMGLYESLFRMMEFLIAEYDQLGKVRERSPNLSGHSSPGGTYETKDGKWMVLVASTDATFERLARAMDRTDLLLDSRFHTNAERLKHDAELDHIVRMWIHEHTQQEVLKKLDVYAVPISPIYSIEDIFNDPHYQARENIVEIEHPRLGSIKIPNVVPRFSKTPGTIRRRAPELGEHNQEIFCEQLGLSSEDLKELQQEGVI
ncbi:CaiB/BaiF CoA transferase family protein [Sulfoacidibacillus thermotolerans]|uniref:Formyl-CoA transferase n=1 Tax=Sulfoacidibacillus thermotolerans TaxID=1765684 RepID=A0A2U3D5Z8_SULT2|nr:CoA transferase [Sulfoacidibacillus thermotolerans]PWI56703.1 formyl-CoA transferase [Sulfoacidibacillus thermotolerans]